MTSLGRIRSIISVFLFLATLIVIGRLIFTHYAWADLARNNEAAGRASATLERATSFLSTVEEAESGQRGYLVTGDSAYLKPYDTALVRIPLLVDELRGLMAGTHEQSEFDELVVQLNYKLNEMGQTVDLMRQHRRDAAVAVVMTNRGEIAMDQIYALSSSIMAQNQLRLRQITQTIDSESRTLELTSLGGGAVLFVLLAATIAMLWKESRQRWVASRHLEEEHELLAQFVRHVPAAVAMFDRDMRYVRVSDRWLLDFSLGSNVIGRSHYEVFPDMPDRWKQVHARALAGETVRSDEDRFERANGSVTCLRWEARPWGSKDGLPEGILIFSEDITRRKTLERALLDEHSRLETIVATAPGAICAFRIDRNGRSSMPYASPRFHAMLPDMPDLTKNAQPLLDAIDPADERRLSAAARKSARTGQLLHESFRITVPERGVVWLDLRAIPARQKDESIVWYGTTIDVTESRAAETALQESQLDYRSLLDNSPDAIARYDRNLRFLYVNRRFTEALGFSEAELIGRRPIEIKQSAVRLMELLGQVFESGNPLMVEHTAKRDGAEKIWQIRIVPELDSDRKVKTLLSIAADVTEVRHEAAMARRREQELHERDSRLAALFDASAQAIFSVDVNGVIQVANRIADKLFGYRDGELVGRGIETLLPENLRQRHREFREMFMLHPEPRTMGEGRDLMGRRKDGSVFPVEISLGYANTLRGRMIVSCVSDISVRKEQEQILRERSAEILCMSEALVTAQEDAARHIARELHDDIAQRLSALSFRVQKIEAAAIAGPAIADVQSLRKNIIEIAEAVEQISHEIHPAILDEMGLVAGIESLCLETGHFQEIEVEFQSTGVPDQVAPEIALCLYRVAQESLRNISRHARATRAEVTIRENEGQLELTVSDNGVGMVPKTRSGGLGMLSMKERMRLVSGTLTVESPGEGVTVTARAPLTRLPALSLN